MDLSLAFLPHKTEKCGTPTTVITITHCRLLRPSRVRPAMKIWNVLMLPHVRMPASRDSGTHVRYIQRRRIEEHTWEVRVESGTNCTSCRSLRPQPVSSGTCLRIPTSCVLLSVRFERLSSTRALLYATIVAASTSPANRRGLLKYMIFRAECLRESRPKGQWPNAWSSGWPSRTTRLAGARFSRTETLYPVLRILHPSTRPI